MNILIVDDHPNIVRVTAMALDLLGCRTFTAGTTAAALELLAAEKIDAVFLDVKLGGECGLEFLSRLVMPAVHPPVIIFTARPRDEVGAEAMRRGAFDCLGKPFSPDDLRKQITRLEQYLAGQHNGLSCQAGRNL